MTPNTSIRITLNDGNGNRWTYTVLALVGASDGAHGVAITEIREATTRNPKEVVRMVPVAEFMAEAARNGKSRADIITALVAKFQANQPKARRAARAS